MPLMHFRLWPITVRLHRTMRMAAPRATIMLVLGNGLVPVPPTPAPPPPPPPRCLPCMRMDKTYKRLHPPYPMLTFWLNMTEGTSRSRSRMPPTRLLAHLPYVGYFTFTHWLPSVDLVACHSLATSHEPKLSTVLASHCTGEPLASV